MASSTKMKTSKIVHLRLLASVVLVASEASEVGSEVTLNRGRIYQFEVAVSNGLRERLLGSGLNDLKGRIEVVALTVSGVGLEV